MQKTFVLRDPIACKQLHAFLRSNWLAMAQAGKPLAVSVSEHKSKRSLDQNALLHAALSQIAVSAWVDGKQFGADTWKEFFRRRLIDTEEIPLPGGGFVERGVSTTTLNVEQFSEFIEQIYAYASTELGVIL